MSDRPATGQFLGCWQHLWRVSEVNVTGPRNQCGRHAKWAFCRSRCLSRGDQNPNSESGMVTNKEVSEYMVCPRLLDLLLTDSSSLRHGFLNLFFRSCFCLIGPLNYIDLFMKVFFSPDIVVDWAQSTN